MATRSRNFTIEIDFYKVRTCCESGQKCIGNHCNNLKGTHQGEVNLWHNQHQWTALYCMHGRVLPFKDSSLSRNTNTDAGPLKEAFFICPLVAGRLPHITGTEYKTYSFHLGSSNRHCKCLFTTEALNFLQNTSPCFYSLSANLCLRQALVEVCLCRKTEDFMATCVKKMYLGFLYWPSSSKKYIFHFIDERLLSQSFKSRVI